MNDDMKLTCESARGLLPGYLDGELSEPQAAPLRAHLLACGSCRGHAVDHKSLSRWFVRETVTVPDGFAARVARRAFAGDPGTLSVSHAGGYENERQLEILPFVLKLTAAAAVLLFGLSLLLKGASLPTEHELQAIDSIPPWERAQLEAELPTRADLPAVAPRTTDSEDDETPAGTR